MNNKFLEACKNSDLETVKYNRYLEIVKHLVSIDTNIHADNDFAIRTASYNGHLEIVKYLVSIGANIHALDDDAIIWAIYNGHSDVVKYLISVGANIDKCNKLTKDNIRMFTDLVNIILYY